MQAKKSKRLYNIVVEFPGGITRTVKVRAVTREVAEAKALKFQPKATGIKHDA